MLRAMFVALAMIGSVQAAGQEQVPVQSLSSVPIVERTEVMVLGTSHFSAVDGVTSSHFDDVIARWHRYLDGDLPGGLDELLADDVVFHSPVVHTPQRGRAVTTQYLEAASGALVGGAGGAFRYTKQVLSGDTAVLEFETTVDEKYVNGVDIIRCDGAGRILEFRVMLRPLQGIQAVHEQMRRALAAGSTAAGGGGER